MRFGQQHQATYDAYKQATGKPLTPAEYARLRRVVRRRPLEGAGKRPISGKAKAA